MTPVKFGRILLTCAGKKPASGKPFKEAHTNHTDHNGEIVSSPKGVSRTTFLVGVVVAILVSSLMSAVISMQYARGPKGDKGDTGPIGPQGPPSISKIPLAYTVSSVGAEANYTYPEWVDIVSVFNEQMSVQVSVENSSNLLIVFQTYLRVYWAPTTIGWARIDIRALVNNIPASPNEMQGVEAPSSSYGASVSGNAPYCGIFWQQASAGVHSVKIQWRVFASNANGPYSAYALNPCLIVYALPNPS